MGFFNFNFCAPDLISLISLVVHAIHIGALVLFPLLHLHRQHHPNPLPIPRPTPSVQQDCGTFERVG